MAHLKSIPGIGDIVASHLLVRIGDPRIVMLRSTSNRCTKFKRFEMSVARFVGDARFVSV